MANKLVIDISPEAPMRNSTGRKYVSLTDENDQGIKIIAAKTGRSKYAVANMLLEYAIKNTAIGK
jgi:hypothetical protein